ncbi:MULTISPECIES: aspartate 1-decarboxylase [Bacillaceae]|uniref:Aspartate 1-decarboxylase n=1 Tax=Pseudobacillus wudalianchiensis TaxID=1743143 RepID=A0A1B9B7C6_9BACI|nr:MULTISPECIES: aspartate 1-decarboxylase [Bacillus]KMY53829.1 L-aspartate 1-decarboxylase [Bacillus sp. FJAT-27231]OCA92021.1 aspartate 1-decarboxylase [Bacillus wudalianchiensis]
MKRYICKGKIHRATVTEANLDYPGSITIDKELMKAVGILPYEMVQITSFRNATRWKTYAIPGEANSGVICLNGPPAHLFTKGDQVVILCIGIFEEDEMDELKTKVAYVDERNNIVELAENPLTDLWGD